MTSSPHGPYALGYTRTTMAMTEGSLLVRVGKSRKSRLSSDCTLQLGCMKLESLVIALSMPPGKYGRKTKTQRN